MSDLKPCPFCGNRAYIIYLDEELEECAYESEIEFYMIKCGSCSGNVLDSDRDAAILAWNSRIFTEGRK